MNADQLGGTSTASTDIRVTWIGGFIRKLKLDEFFAVVECYCGKYESSRASPSGS